MARAQPLCVVANGQGAFAVSGEITFDNAAQARKQAPMLDENQNIDVDLGGLVGAESATLAVLIDWAAQAHACGAALHFRNPPQALCNLAHLSDVDGLLGLG